MFDLIRPELDATDRKLVDTLEAFYPGNPGQAARRLAGDLAGVSR